MISKKFDKTLYDLNDDVAKGAAVGLFGKLFPHTEIKENTDKYGIDMIIYEDGEVVGYLETEVKNVWKGDSFPFSTIQFPKRKVKFISLKVPTFFCMINSEGTKALVITGNDLIESPLKMVSNKYIQEGEYFFQVDKKRARFFDL